MMLQKYDQRQSALSEHDSSGFGNFDVWGLICCGLPVTEEDIKNCKQTNLFGRYLVAP